MADKFMKHHTDTTASLMKRLREGTITPDQLTRLQEIMAESDDTALIAAIEESATDCDAPTADDTARLKRRIDHTLRAIEAQRIQAEAPSTERRERHAAVTLRRVWTAAAAVMLPCLICAVAYLWISARHDSRAMITLTTRPLDTTELTLPDGTGVRLRGNSTLRFGAILDASGAREVSLDGQAYFKVAKDTRHRFIVKTPGLDVTVHGTEFSIASRKSSDFAEVILDRGAVTVEACGRSLALAPGQTALLDRRSGSLRVIATGSALKADWDNDELHFDNISPDSLIAEIEKAYDIRLDRSITSHIDRRFTGTLPWNDLGLTLEVLRYVYGFDLPYHAAP
nr:FecR domain-containing protein [Paramuribaculum intestinale]